MTENSDQYTKEIEKIYYLDPFINESLNWKNNSFYFPGMERMGIYADGSCFFHAILMAYYVPYRRGRIGNKAINRREMTSEFRKELSRKLSDNVDSNDSSSPTFYQTISRGQLEDFSSHVPSYSINNMKKELASSNSVDNVYNEFVSDVLNKDIYILDVVAKDVYITGKDIDILYKGRPSIVLLYIPGHYELVGIRDKNDNLNTLFDPTNPFIQAILRRMKDKIRST